MAKRMKFSVVGLPHYTIWHLYEPSVEDLRHMEEMDKERKEKEAKEKAEKDRMDKIKAQFDNPSTQWDKDKADIRDMAKKEYVTKEGETAMKKPHKANEKAKGSAEKEKTGEQAKAKKVE